MNPTTQTYQDSLPTQLAKEGLAIAEAPLKKTLANRAALVKSLYTTPMTEAAFNRAKAEEEMIKAVAGYNVAVEALFEAYTLEMQTTRETMAAKDAEILQLRAELMEWAQAYRLKSEGESVLLDQLLKGVAA